MSRRSLRRAQAIVPFGVGAIVDFPGESLMLAGLDAWKVDDPALRVEDRRLAERLHVESFRQPPPAKGREGGKRVPLPFVRFPLWHRCPRCSALVKARPDDNRPRRCSSAHETDRQSACGSFPERRRLRMVPVRFVAICPHGHLEDFPWIEWAHTSRGEELVRGQACEEPELHLYSTGRSGLGGTVVKCERCDHPGRSLIGAADPDGILGFECEGERPWLGPEGRDRNDCPERMRMALRGATNLHFSRVASSILIPPWSSRIRQRIREPLVWETLMNGIPEGELPHRDRVETVASMQGLDPDDIIHVLQQERAGSQDAGTQGTEQDYRRPEHRILSRGTTDSRDLLALRPQDLDRYEPCVREYLDRIVLVEKLAETRALVGFTRVDPPAGAAFDVDWDRLALERQSWLPAFRVFGEGIFITLREERVRRWAQDTERLLGDLVGRGARVLEGRGSGRREITPPFILLHTLAHLLMRRLSFECGYGSSSLRERLYWSGADGAENWMCGLLIYTAAGDSEGTMGGLVRQGRPGRLEDVLCNALREAYWCSSDPLCRESSGQGTDSLNLAACHACSLVPETSCEEGNRLLDRLAVVGLAEESSGARGQEGFFAPLVRQLLEFRELSHDTGDDEQG